MRFTCISWFTIQPLYRFNSAIKVVIVPSFSLSFLLPLYLSLSPFLSLSLFLCHVLGLVCKLCAYHNNITIMSFTHTIDLFNQYFTVFSFYLFSFSGFSSCFPTQFANTLKCYTAMITTQNISHFDVSMHNRMYENVYLNNSNYIKYSTVSLDRVS